jgi:hypothetical protein
MTEVLDDVAKRLQAELSLAHDALELAKGLRISEGLEDAFTRASHAPGKTSGSTYQTVIVEDRDDPSEHPVGGIDDRLSDRLSNNTEGVLKLLGGLEETTLSARHPTEQEVELAFGRVDSLGSDVGSTTSLLNSRDGLIRSNPRLTEVLLGLLDLIATRKRAASSLLDLSSGSSE